MESEQEQEQSDQEQSDQEQTPTPTPKARPVGRPFAKVPIVPDELKGSIQIVKSEFVKKTPTNKSRIMTEAELAKTLLPKKPISEAQREHIAKMIAGNKAMRESKKAINIPTEIPEGYEAVFIPPSSSIYSKPAKAPVAHHNQILYDMMHKMNEQMNSLNSRFADKPQPRPPKPTKKSRREKEETSQTETETDTETETGYDTSDTEYVKKYTKKAEKRIKAVENIEAKLNKNKVQPTPPPPMKPKSKYDSMSIF